MKAFKTFEQCPEDKRPKGIPLVWPWQCQDCTEEEQAQLESAGFIVLSEEAYIQYLADRQSLVDSWNLTNKKVPKSVTPRQFRLALVYTGFNLSNIDTLIESLQEPTKSAAKITWEYSVEFMRDNPMLNSMAPALGLTQANLDDLFILGAGL